MTWFHYTIIATVVYGILNFLYKVAISSGATSLRILKYQSLTVSILSLIVFIVSKRSINLIHIAFVFALLNSTFYFLGSNFKLNALKYIPVNIAAPLQKLNTVFVIIIGIIFFKEKPGISQLFGIILAFITVLILSLDTAGRKNHSKIKPKGFIFAITAALCIALSMTIGKIASLETDKMTYMLISYFLVYLYSLSTEQISAKNIKNIEHNITIIFICIFIGILNFIGYYMVLQAWSTGPLILVQALFSMAMIITIILAKIFYKERFTALNIIAIMASLLSAYLLKT